MKIKEKDGKMNNRFKFRVWDNINKRYENDLPLIDKDGDLCYQNGHKYCNGEYPEDFTIEQCTGAKDKNSKLIYEGDIVLGSWNTKLIVFWDAVSVEYRVKPVSGGGDREFHYFSDIKGLDDGTISYRNFEIIGNVHQMEIKR
jgi:uncharacterized phage protein (TIGR01671 family)